MPAQFQRPVPLEHDDGFRIGPAGDDGGDLPAAAPEARLEPLDIHGTVPRGVRGQAEQNLAVHLGEASELPAPEEVIGVVDGAVVGADDVPGPDRVVVAIDPFIPAGPPTRVAEQNRCTVVDTGQEFGEGFVRDEPLGRHLALEEPVPVFARFTVGKCLFEDWQVRPMDRAQSILWVWVYWRRRRQRWVIESSPPQPRFL